MKSMTDFIMEQEMPSVEEEVFNESALVSQFMGMQAAAAEMNCIYEYASIVTFCESNDIEIPEMLVQEGFKDTWNNILTAISNFFKKIAEWFKSLVKGTVATFSSAKLNEIIAKLETYSADEPLTEKKIIHPAIIYVHIVGALEAYRDFVINPIADGAASDDVKDEDENRANDFISKLQDYMEDLKTLKEASNWKSATGEIKTGFELKVLNKYSQDAASADLNELVKQSTKTDTDVTYGWLIDVLKTVNRLNIPNSGTKILSALNASETKFTKLKNSEKIKIEVKTGDNVGDLARANNVDEANMVSAFKTSSIAIDSDGKASSDGTVEVSTIARWIADPEVQKNVKDAADLLATVYDKAKTCLADTAALVFKDLKKAEGDAADKQYQASLKALTGASGTGILTKDNSIIGDNKSKLSVNTKNK